MVILTCRRSPACRGVEAKAPDVLQRTAEPIPKQLKFSALARYSFPLVLDTVIDTGDDRDRDIHEHGMPQKRAATGHARGCSVNDVGTLNQSE